VELEFDAVLIDAVQGVLVKEGRGNEEHGISESTHLQIAMERSRRAVFSWTEPANDGFLSRKVCGSAPLIE
jgi:hypothetical protein